MKLDVEIVNQDRPPRPDALCVAVDVIRYSTTSAALCSRVPNLNIGPPRDDQILTWRETNRDGLVFGEWGGIKLDEADYDNSPAAALTADPADRPILLCSSHGAPLTLSLPVGRTWVAGFATLSATVARLSDLARRENRPIDLYPAGPGPEDGWCCESLARLLLDPDLEAAAEFGGREALFNRLGEISPRSKEDLRLCADIDRFGFTIKLTGTDGRTFGLLTRED